MTPDGKRFLVGAKSAREVELDPCRPQPVTLIAKTRVALGAPPSWDKVYEHGMALVGTVSE